MMSMKRFLLTVPLLALLSVASTCQTTHSAVLSWTASSTSGATYQVLSAPTATGSFTTVTSGLSVLTFTVTGLPANTGVCFEVVAQSTGNSDSVPSNVVCGTTLQNQTAPPGALTVIFK